MVPEPPTPAPGVPPTGPPIPERIVVPEPAASAVAAVSAPTRESAASFSNVFLNAGAAIGFNSAIAAGSAVMESLGNYSGTLGDGQPAGLPLFLPEGGGLIAVNNVPGGPDVGAFFTQFSIAPPIVWTNMSSMPKTISCSKGLTVTWSGGNPSGFVRIVATTQNVAGLQAAVGCTAPVSAGQFTIPPSAMMVLLPTSLSVLGNNLPTTSLSVQTQDQFPFTAPGLDVGIIYVEIQNELTVPISVTSSRRCRPSASAERPRPISDPGRLLRRRRLAQHARSGARGGSPRLRALLAGRASCHSRPSLRQPRSRDWAGCRGHDSHLRASAAEA